MQTWSRGVVALCLVVSGCNAGGWRDAPGSPDVTATWYADDGTVATRSNRSFEVHGLRGAEHCDWGSMRFLSVLWPLGRRVREGEDIDASDTRQYVRDPQKGLGSGVELLGELDLAARLPRDAMYSGYRTDEVELWFGPDVGDRYAYLVMEGRTERWPRAQDHVACA